MKKVTWDWVKSDPAGTRQPIGDARSWLWLKSCDRRSREGVPKLCIQAKQGQWIRWNV